MYLAKIRLALARTQEFPEGSADHGYEFIAHTISTLPRGSAYVVTSNVGRVTRMFSFEESIENRTTE